MELIAVWFLIPERFEIEHHLDYYLLIQGFLQLAIVLVFMWLINRRGQKKLTLRSNIKWYLLAAIIGCLFIVFQTPLKWFYNLICGTEYLIEYNIDGLSVLKNINILSIIFFTPVAEELFFRGYIQRGLHSKMKPWIAILMATLLFACIHAPYMNLFLSELNKDWHTFYITFFGGLISGILYYKSKSMGPSIIFHVCWNLMAVIV